MSKERIDSQVSWEKILLENGGSSNAAATLSAASASQPLTVQSVPSPFANASASSATDSSTSAVSAPSECCNHKCSDMSPIINRLAGQLTPNYCCVHASHMNDSKISGISFADIDSKIQKLTGMLFVFVFQIILRVVCICSLVI